MDRRQVLVTAFAAVAAGTAGCLGDDAQGTPTETDTAPETRTQAQDLGTIEYTVTNEDDEAHRLGVTMTNAAGTVVQETNEPEFAPGTSVSSGDAGHEPDAGPFTLTFTIPSTSESYEWDVRECARLDLAVTITADAAITVERTLCQN